MDFSPFPVAVIAVLFLSFLQDRVSASAAVDGGVEITYGSVIKLMHERTNFRLHSHDIAYGSGSGQQSVTGSGDVDDANSYWIVRPSLDSSAKQGNVIPWGTIIRLQHMTTRRWLHSHLHASPISGNLEVSCFGGDGESDTGDHWQLDIEDAGTWKQNQKVRFRHINTGGYLYSHNKRYQRIIEGQQEPGGIRWCLSKCTSNGVISFLSCSHRDRFVVSKGNGPTIYGSQPKESTFQLLEASDYFLL